MSESLRPNVVVELHVCHGKIFVWDPQIVIYLRHNCRIVGRCIGSFPVKPRQNAHMGLPLQLNCYEAKLVTEYYHGQFVKSYFPEIHDEKRTVESLSKQRQVQLKIQTHLKRNHELHSNSEPGIVEAESEEQKNTDTCTADKSYFKNSGEIATDHINAASSMMVNVSTFAEDNIRKTWIKINHQSDYTKEYPMINNPFFHEMNNLHYKVFKDLHERGFYLTDGTQFGGHFLVYPGDPAVYHSQYIALCVPEQKALHSADYCALGRLATSVKKTLLICYLGEDEQVVYISMAWSGIV